MLLAMARDSETVDARTMKSPLGWENRKEHILAGLDSYGLEVLANLNLVPVMRIEEAGAIRDREAVCCKVFRSQGVAASATAFCFCYCDPAFAGLVSLCESVGVSGAFSICSVCVRYWRKYYHKTVKVCPVRA